MLTLCQHYANTGKVDALIGVSYNDERTKHLIYPDRAKENKLNKEKNKYRIMETQYAIVTLKDQNVEFSGNYKIIPKPIYVPAGFSIGKDLKEHGLEVDAKAQMDVLNFKKLLQRKIGSVVVIAPLARKYVANSNQGHKLHISKMPIKVKDSYISFSKKGNSTEKQRKLIWTALELIRIERLDTLLLRY
jgi:hypothetical protein